MDESFEQSINLIYQSFNLKELDAKTLNALNQFMDAYNQTLNEHLNSNITSAETLERLRILTGPIQKALNTPDDGNLYPAIKFIKNKLSEQGKEMEKPFAKLLRNPAVPALSSSSDDINGFSFAIIIVCFTIVIGMVLGALLFLLR